MLKNRLLYAALLICLIFFHAFYTGWISWFLLIFTLCLPLLSLLCSLPFLLSQQFSAQLPAQCLRGEERGIRLINQSATHMPALPCSFQLVCADRPVVIRAQRVIDLALASGVIKEEDLA